MAWRGGTPPLPPRRGPATIARKGAACAPSRPRSALVPAPARCWPPSARWASCSGCDPSPSTSAAATRPPVPPVPHTPHTPPPPPWPVTPVVLGVRRGRPDVVAPAYVDEHAWAATAAGRAVSGG